MPIPMTTMQYAARIAMSIAPSLASMLYRPIATSLISRRASPVPPCACGPCSAVARGTDGTARPGNRRRSRATKSRTLESLMKLDSNCPTLYTVELTRMTALWSVSILARSFAQAASYRSTYRRGNRLAPPQTPP